MTVTTKKYAKKSVTVAVGNSDINGFEILLDKGSIIKGVVKDAAGKVLAKRQILILPFHINSFADFASNRGEYNLEQNQSTDSNGEFEIGGLPAGKYDL